jgi:hypothetical protein
MGTKCSSEQLTFEGFEGRQVVGSFDGGAGRQADGAVCLAQQRCTVRYGEGAAGALGGPAA